MDMTRRTCTSSVYSGHRRVLPAVVSRAVESRHPPRDVQMRVDASDAASSVYIRQSQDMGWMVANINVIDRRQCIKYPSTPVGNSEQLLVT